MTRWGERKPKDIVWKIICEQYPKQVLFFVKVNTNGKLETRTKGIVDQCSDLTCTKEYAFTEGPKPRGELTWATCSLPPVILCLLRAYNCDSSFANITSTNLSNVNPNSDQKSFSSLTKKMIRIMWQSIYLLQVVFSLFLDLTHLKISPIYDFNNSYLFLF